MFEITWVRKCTFPAEEAMKHKSTAKDNLASELRGATGVKYTLDFEGQPWWGGGSWPVNAAAQRQMEPGEGQRQRPEDITSAPGSSHA